MILLDTNVVSSIMQVVPNDRVLAWLDLQPPDTIWTTSITVFEIEAGLARLPGGRRRDRLTNTFHRLIHSVLSNRVAAFDYASAIAAAHLDARRQQLGRPVDMRDTQIAGIALARRATVATRNTKDFHGLDTPVIDPWQVTP